METHHNKLCDWEYVCDRRTYSYPDPRRTRWVVHYPSGPCTYPSADRPPLWMLQSWHDASSFLRFFRERHWQAFQWLSRRGRLPSETKDYCQHRVSSISITPLCAMNVYSTFLYTHTFISPKDKKLHWPTAVMQKMGRHCEAVKFTTFCYSKWDGGRQPQKLSHYSV